MPTDSQLGYLGTPLLDYDFAGLARGVCCIGYRHDVHSRGEAVGRDNRRPLPRLHILGRHQRAVGRNHGDQTATMSLWQRHRHVSPGGHERGCDIGLHRRDREA